MHEMNGLCRQPDPVYTPPRLEPAIALQGGRHTEKGNPAWNLVCADCSSID